MDMIETKALEFAYPAEEGEKPVLALRGVDIDPAVYTVEALERQLLALRKGGAGC